MPRACSICNHPGTAAIAKAIAAGGSNRDVAARFHVGHAAVQRHRVGCLKSPRRSKPAKSTGRDSSTPSVDGSPRFATDADGRCANCGQLTGDEALDPKAILRRAERLLATAERIALRAERDDDSRLALSAVDRAQRSIDTLAKITGLLPGDAPVTFIDQRQLHLNALIAGKSDEELEAMLAGLVEDGRRALSSAE